MSSISWLERQATIFSLKVHTLSHLLTTASRRSRLTYSLAGTWSEPLPDAILPSAAEVEQDPLDNDARKRINVALHPNGPTR